MYGYDEYIHITWWGWGWNKNLIAVRLGYGDEDEFFYLRISIGYQNVSPPPYFHSYFKALETLWRLVSMLSSTTSLVTEMRPPLVKFNLVLSVSRMDIYEEQFHGKVRSSLSLLHPPWKMNLWHALRLQLRLISCRTLFQDLE